MSVSVVTLLDGAPLAIPGPPDGPAELIAVVRAPGPVPDGVRVVEAFGASPAEALDLDVSRAAGDMIAVMAPVAVPLPGALALVDRLAGLFPDMAWLSPMHSLHRDGGRLVPGFLPGFCRAAFLDGAFGPLGPAFAGHIPADGVFFRPALWHAAGGTLARGPFGLWERFFARAEPCCLPAALVISPTAPACGADAGAFLAAARERAGYRVRAPGANGFRVYEGRFVSAEPSLVEAPFVVIDGDGPSRGLKEVVAARSIA
ncbi:MAG: DUF935 domain-containing protein [Caulobacter sp.]|nr:DUF935 domain-containing protein [Caulobacter sp.]